ncbi:hypothetical protein NQ156_00665 [Microbacterium sp. zg.Y625]|uniref:hypothetical protein n=1 Tax=Microbacterium jiangjiandongii TaxID=3049071 RepID=UPI00214C4EA2|nr:MULTISPECIES: hypothetical protein [unclassified Microbacterium]MCR2791571.1 hypothetical protein [Microbacterium sp. zg.Y625]WIM24398.1 hypothetical protein QNO14_09575 [Microbacterium sp. zg-Y625]
MSVLPGNPTSLADRSASYVSSASLIQQAADDLRAIAYESTARSMDGIRDLSAEVASDLDRAHERYSGTARALQEYAVALKAAHDRADDAEIAEARAQAGAATAEYELRASERRLHLLGEADAPAGNIRSAQEEVDAARARTARMDAAAQAARAEIEAARQDMERAAQIAIDRIDSAIDGTNDGFWDRVRNVIDDVGDVLGDIGRWVGDFLADVYAELQRIMSTVVALLGVAVILVLVYALLAAVPFIGPAIAALVTAALAAFLLASVLSDVRAPTPVVHRRDLTDRESADKPGQPSDLAGVLADAGFVDTLGRTYDADGEVTAVEATVIGVTRVVDADGVVRWRVALPSTQEWLSRLGGDQGGVHDLDSNLALVLTPALRSQYERAVIAAMQQAGVGPNDPVMLVGFSQGGIMAGTLAAYNTDYNWSAVVAAGAPIDHMPIPPRTQVVSVQHDGDPVPRLDSVVTLGLDGQARQQPHWTTIQTASPRADEGLHGIHSADAYDQTLQHRIDTVPADTTQDLDAYFVGDDNAYGYEQRYYGWSE